MLKDTVEKIIKKYGMDAIYIKDNTFLTWDEVCQDLADNFSQIIKKEQPGGLIIYPGGNLGLTLANILLQAKYSVEYIIDNYPTAKEYMGIPIITYPEYLEKERIDTILLSSPANNEAFYNSLLFDGYEGSIIDIFKYLQETYRNLDKIPDFNNPCLWWNYSYLNRLETECISSKGNIRAERLRTLIYGLVTIRDFCFAEKYIEELISIDAHYQNYRSAIQEIKDALWQTASIKAENVWFIHILDALAESHVDKIPALKKLAEDGIRFKGITTEYPYTKFAISTMFSGRSCLDIWMKDSKIHYSDSELFKYIEEKGIKFSFLSGYNSLLEMLKPVNHYDNKNSGDTNAKSLLHVPYQMFEGLCVMEKEPQNHLIAMHSIGIHPPFSSLGSGAKCLHLSVNVSMKEAYTQFDNTLAYLDKQIEWYFTYYQNIGCPNIIAGDHGISIATSVAQRYAQAVKKDIPFFHHDIIFPAFIVSGLHRKKVVDGIISNREIPNLLLDIMRKENLDDLDRFTGEHAFLCTLPLYSENPLRFFVPRGMFIMYEGVIGVKTQEELYLRSISGRELYYRPGEHSYRNLIHMDEYKDAVGKCRSLLEGKKYPPSIYRQDKYKFHLSVLQLHDKECYDKIMELLKEEEL